MTTDLVWMTGKNACAVAAQLGHKLGADLNCTATQYVSVGWIILGLAVATLFALRHARIEQRRHDNYLL